MERNTIMIAGILAFFTVMLFGTVTVSPLILGANTSTVTTHVNISNVPPVINTVSLAPSSVDLTPGGIKTVNCTASVNDINGWSTVSINNATFFDTTNGYNQSTADDGNYHYTNTSCASCTTINATDALCACSFSVQYYANNATWECNISLSDQNFTVANSSTALVNSVLGLDVPSEIDYGDVVVTSESNEVEVNITNYGNIPMNLTVRGYGGDDPVVGENLSMICDSGNISIGWERYATTEASAFSSMINLTRNNTLVSKFRLAQRINESGPYIGIDLNATYWKQYVPTSVAGYCNGTVVFSAISATGV